MSCYFPGFLRSASFMLLALSVCLAPPQAARAATFDVDTTTDSATATDCDDATPDDCSLRGAILAANALSEASTINAPAGTYVLSQSSTCTYRVKTNSASFTSSQIPLCLSKPIIIRRAGAASTIIDGNQRGHMLFVTANAVMEVQGLTLTNGIGAGFPVSGRSGGGIQNHGTLTLTEAVVSNSTLPAGGSAFGAGIYNCGSLALHRSAVVNNSSLSGSAFRGGPLSGWQDQGQGLRGEESG